MPPAPASPSARRQLGPYGPAYSLLLERADRRDEEAAEAAERGDDEGAERARWLAADDRSKAEALESKSRELRRDHRGEWQRPSRESVRRHAAALGRPRGMVAPRRGRRPAGRPGGPRRTTSRQAGARGDPHSAEGEEGEPAPFPARLSFGSFHSLTAGLSGPERLRAFSALPKAAQEAAWRELGRAVEVGRR